MNSFIRTDLAMESVPKSGKNEADIPGLDIDVYRRDGITVTQMLVSAEGSVAIGKPEGKYITLELESLLRREENAFARSAEALAEELKSLLNLDKNSPVLVAGLGNRAITPDAIGPETADSTLITRHLRQELPEYFGNMRPVAAVCSGVVGTTGVESGDIVACLCQEVHPEAVIAVDALAARSCDRLCRTIQLSDSGIIPGSGVGNARRALNRETLGVPVIAIGVPTVVDAATLTMDMAEQAGLELSRDRLPKENLIVTPRDIDRLVHDTSKLVAYGINLALHDGITIAELDMLLS